MSRLSAASGFSPIFRAELWKETASLLLALPLGVVLFTMVVTSLALGLGLSLTIIGIPLLVLTVGAGRAIAQVGRARVAALHGVELPAWSPLERSSTLVGRARKGLADTAGWKGLLYGVAMLPWGIVAFTVVVTMWSLAVGLVAAPIAAFNGSTSDAPEWLRDTITGDWRVRLFIALALMVVGLVALVMIPGAVHRLAEVDTWLARVLLSPGRTNALEERVAVLQRTREGSVAASASELRRIERDLHDGAPQRLVNIAMNLGLAKERVALHSDDVLTELVTRSHQDAKDAIVELRDLVRGVQPAILSERGLSAALVALAARCPVPIALDVDSTARWPVSVETTAYFVVAEALTNIAKHSDATSGSVTISAESTQLRISVSDNGRGGVVISPTGGLGGIEDRVRAIDGTLHVVSPDGGPTHIVVELPCG